MASLGRKSIQIFRATVVAWMFVFVLVTAEAQSELAGISRGFPSLRDLTGNKLADGEFSQWLENGRLHIRITYEFGGGRRVEETATLRLEPQIAQEEWSWRELHDGEIYRSFELNINTKKAIAQTNEAGNPKRWEEQVDVQAGRTFAGIGFALAIQTLRDRLIKGERIELQGVGFTPQPHAVPVEISYGGLDQMAMADRVLRGDRFVIHPKLPWLVGLVVKAPDFLVWLLNTPPTAFLRFEGPLAEPSDPIVRIDVLPGAKSGPAQPVGTNERPAR